MSLELNTSKLSAAINGYAKSKDALNLKLHLIACSAVALAARDGRCEWMNELYSKLDKLTQDAFKAWVSPFSGTFDTPEVAALVAADPKFQRPRWIKFSKDEGFKVIPGLAANRPKLPLIEAVLADFANKFMMHKTAREVVETAWDAGLMAKFESLKKAVEKAAKEHSTHPVVRERLAELDKYTKMLTVDATKVLSGLAALEVPVEETETEGERKAREKAEKAANRKLLPASNPLQDIAA